MTTPSCATVADSPASVQVHLQHDANGRQHRTPKKQKAARRRPPVESRRGLLGVADHVHHGSFHVLVRSGGATLGRHHALLASEALDGVLEQGFFALSDTGSPVSLVIQLGSTGNASSVASLAGGLVQGFALGQVEAGGGASGGTGHGSRSSAGSGRCSVHSGSSSSGRGSSSVVDGGSSAVNGCGSSGHGSGTGHFDGRSGHVGSGSCLAGGSGVFLLAAGSEGCSSSDGQGEQRALNVHDLFLRFIGKVRVRHFPVTSVAKRCRRVPL